MKIEKEKHMDIFNFNKIETLESFLVFRPLRWLGLSPEDSAYFIHKTCNLGWGEKFHMRHVFENQEIIIYGELIAFGKIRFTVGEALNPSMEAGHKGMFDPNNKRPLPC